jgi:phosphatidate cytidylyltransferase
MLLPRILTGVVGAGLVIASIFFGGLPFLFIVLGVVLLGLREFYSLAEETGYPSYHGMGVLCGALVVLSVFLNGVSFGAVTDNQTTSALLGLIMIFIVTRSLAKGPADTSLSEWGITLLGVFYVAWSLSHLLLIRDLRPGGRDITYLLFAMIWAEDTAAYFVGVRWGRHPIARSISPKKSWEGTLAGLVAAAAVAALFQTTLLRQSLRLVEAVLLALVIGVLAFLSDLGESLLKRGAGIKDSSRLLPGHGGILDRFDSFFLTAPLYYYYWAFLKH